MSGGILIEISPGETRAAIVDGKDRLTELLIERQDRAPLEGGIHLGRVTRVEVVAYREPYGEGIRSKRFRKQFVGKEAASGFRPGHDIDVISGATLSAHAMAKAVKRATLLLHDALLTSS